MGALGVGGVKCCAKIVRCLPGEMVPFSFLLAYFFPAAQLAVKSVVPINSTGVVSFLFEVRCDAELLNALSGETLKPSCLSEKGAAKTI
jgi:hypothetical protein